MCARKNNFTFQIFFFVLYDNNLDRKVSLHDMTMCFIFTQTLENFLWPNVVKIHNTALKKWFDYIYVIENYLKMIYTRELQQH